MAKKTLLLAFTFLTLLGCQPNGSTAVQTEKTTVETVDTLKQRAADNADPSKWDRELLQQDIETYAQYGEILSSYPLNKSPFPVATYDYAVSGIPFILEMDQSIFQGVRIGEYTDSETDEINDKLTLLVMTNDSTSLNEVLVESRNYPYLTAEGRFEAMNNRFDWVFSASPDGYSTLLINMKLFDLRYGETVIIYPEEDRSFFYKQLELSPNDFESMEEFESAVAGRLVDR
jgi:hypothetical protein